MPVPKISIIIPTYNPDHVRLRLVLRHLKEQSIVRSEFEVIIVDNASSIPVASWVDPVDFTMDLRVVREDEAGLTHARNRGVSEMRADMGVFVDDDNFLDQDYLAHSLEIMESAPALAAMGGKNLPEWEGAAPLWYGHLKVPLGLVDHGETELRAEWSDPPRVYPDFAPIGAGMVFRREAYGNYRTAQKRRRFNLTDRRGASLASAGDNDIAMTMLSHGWSVGYSPKLSLRHFIPCGRCETKYLRRLIYCSSRDWTLVCHLHRVGACKTIAGATLPLRIIRALFRFAPWKSLENQFMFAMALGVLDGQSKAVRIR